MAFSTPQARAAGLGTSGKEVLHWGLYSGQGERGYWGKEGLWDLPRSAWGNWPQRVAVGEQGQLGGAKGRIQRPATSFSLRSHLWAGGLDGGGWLGRAEGAVRAGVTTLYLNLPPYPQLTLPARGFRRRRAP